MYNETAHKILDAAQVFTQMRGFNGFSYRDLQQEVGVKTSSIHYYFPTKQDLVVAMLERYLGVYSADLEAIEAKHAQPLDRLLGLAQVFADVAAEDKFCLCGMIAAEVQAISDQGVVILKQFFETNEAWIEAQLVEAQSAGYLKPIEDTEALALSILSALEGAMLVARSRQTPEHVVTVLRSMLTTLKP